MSDIPRDEATGQFAGEQKFGLAGLEADAGWTPLVKPETDAELDEAQAAEEIVARREDEQEPEKIGLYNHDRTGLLDDLENPDHEGPKISLTPESAAYGLTAYREYQAELDQAVADIELLDSVDALDKTAEVGAKGDEVPAEPGEPAKTADPQAEALQWLEDHPEAHAALSEHVQQSTAAAEQARAAYAQQLDGALAVARQVTFAMVPELRGVTDANHAVSVLSAIQQQNPQRFAQIQQLDRETGQLMAAAQNERQAALQRELRAILDYNAEQSKAYETKYGAVDRATADGVRSYLQGLGATEQDFVQLQQSRVPLWAQKALIDAAQYHKLMSNPPKPSRQPLPPVQRPGAAQPRGAARASDLRSLTAKLDSSGRIEDAVAMLSAMRESRK
ncbi:hypothetical protein ACVINW_006337 [Bradyrhizobium sp. USDA 4461]